LKSISAKLLYSLHTQLICLLRRGLCLSFESVLHEACGLLTSTINKWKAQLRQINPLYQTILACARPTRHASFHPYVADIGSDSKFWRRSQMRHLSPDDCGTCDPIGTEESVPPRVSRSTTGLRCLRVCAFHFGNDVSFIYGV
jgi:hypothetical protein